LVWFSCRSLAFFSEFKFDPSDEAAFVKELVLQVRKTIGPFAAPKKIYVVSDLPKTRSGKVWPTCAILITDILKMPITQIMRRIMRKIVAGEGDQLGDLSTLAEPGVVDQIKAKVSES
jgi:acetyl-CoA synthetase